MLTIDKHFNRKQEQPTEGHHNVEIFGMPWAERVLNGLRGTTANTIGDAWEVNMEDGSTRTSMGQRSASRHTRIVSSQLQLARLSPSGLQASARTPPSCPVSAPAGLPVSAFHSRTTPVQMWRTRAAAGSQCGFATSHTSGCMRRVYRLSTQSEVGSSPRGDLSASAWWSGVG